jgi:hypothetical protein
MPKSLLTLLLSNLRTVQGIQYLSDISYTQYIFKSLHLYFIQTTGTLHHSNDSRVYKFIYNRVKCKYQCKIQFGFNVQFQQSLVLLEIK